MGDTVILKAAANGDYETAGNWQANGPPAATDVVTLPNGNTSVLDANINQADIALLSFTIEKGYSALVGSIADGEITPLQIAATTFNLAGSGASYFECTANGTATCNVKKAAASAGVGLYGLHLTSADAISVLNIDLASGESVGVAAIAGTSGEFTTINIDGDGDVTLGAGLTCSTLNVSGNGNVYGKASIADINIKGGSPHIYLEDAVAVSGELLAQAGVIYNNSTGTIATTSIFPGAMVNLTEGPQARVMTAINVYGNGGFDDSDKHLATCVVNDYGDGDNIKLGSNKKITRASI